MTKEQLISRLKELFPDLYIGNKYREFISRGLVSLRLEDEGVILPGYYGELDDREWCKDHCFYKNLNSRELSKLKKTCIEEWGKPMLPYESITDDIIDIIKRGFYGCEVEHLRHGDFRIDQLVFIHPDCDESNIGEILRDAKYIYGEVGSWNGALAVINQGDWDFSNDALRDVLMEHTNDCFTFGEEDKDILTDDEVIEKLYNQMKSDHPEVEDMPFIMTDYD